MAEFELPFEIRRNAELDGISPEEAALRIFRDSLRYDNPLARPEEIFFVLSIDRYDGRFYVAGSFPTDREAVDFARQQTEEAKTWSDEMLVVYYPFSIGGDLVPG